jgi:DNA-binding helix-hairpin-helix protein with protein kinase domain
MEVQFSDGTREQYEDTPLASGGQGEVFRSTDRRHVVKLYTTSQSAQQVNDRLDKIIGKYNVVGNDPYWIELFAWPDKRAVSPRIGVRMRYVSDLKPIINYFYQSSYRALTPEQRGWWIGRVASAIKLTRAVWRMARNGLCHSDLSDKNLMVDPFDGRLTIIDCDSIVVPGEMPAEVLGTWEYMAPELVSGKVAAPTIETDRHALAVLLYRWLLFRHPLFGPKIHSQDTDLDDKLRLGDRALYVEHPTDTSNRPKNLMMTADKLTPRLNDLFQEAFVTYLHEPGLRPTPDRWERALLEMLDRIIPCANPACELKYFPAPDAGPIRCPLCDTFADFPGRLPFLKLRRPLPDHQGIRFMDEGRHPHYIVGWPERPIYSWHAYQDVKVTPDTSAALPDTSPQALIRFDANSQEWYLENLKLPDLQASLDGTSWTPIVLSARVPLAQNTQLQLGPLDRGRRAFVELRRVNYA